MVPALTPRGRGSIEKSRSLIRAISRAWRGNAFAIKSSPRTRLAAAAIRALPRQHTFADDLNLPPWWKRLSRLPHGLVLIGGLGRVGKIHDTGRPP